MLNDAIEACAAKPAATDGFKREICFTDPVIDASDVLERFLHFMMKGEGATWDDKFNDCEALCRTVSFMKKYEREFTLSFFKRYVRGKHQGKEMAPFHVFMLATAMDDVELSIAAFRNVNSFKPAYCRRTDIPGVTSGHMAAALLNLTLAYGGDSAWPFELSTYIPADYLWAANKAWGKKWAQTVAIDAAREQDAGQQSGGSSAAGGNLQPLKRRRTQLVIEVPRARSSSGKLVHSLAGVTTVDIAAEYEAAIKAAKKPAADGKGAGKARCR